MIEWIFSQICAGIQCHLTTVKFIKNECYVSVWRGGEGRVSAIESYIVRTVDFEFISYRRGNLHTDASKYGYGAILFQKNSEDQRLHPVYYASGKTTSAEEKYSSYELEVLAIVRALKRFRVYLLDISFKIVRDCRAFALTMAKRDLCMRVTRWTLLLEEFNYVIEHIDRVGA